MRHTHQMLQDEREAKVPRLQSPTTDKLFDNSKTGKQKAPILKIQIEWRDNGEKWVKRNGFTA